MMNKFCDEDYVLKLIQTSPPVTDYMSLQFKALTILYKTHTSYGIRSQIIYSCLPQLLHPAFCYLQKTVDTQVRNRRTKLRNVVRHLQLHIDRVITSGKQATQPAKPATGRVSLDSLRLCVACDAYVDPKSHVCSSRVTVDSKTATGRSYSRTEEGVNYDAAPFRWSDAFYQRVVYVVMRNWEKGLYRQDTENIYPTISLPYLPSWHYIQSHKIVGQFKSDSLRQDSVSEIEEIPNQTEVEVEDSVIGLSLPQLGQSESTDDLTYGLSIASLFERRSELTKNLRTINSYKFVNSAGTLGKLDIVLVLRYLQEVATQTNCCVLLFLLLVMNIVPQYGSRNFVCWRIFTVVHPPPSLILSRRHH